MRKIREVLRLKLDLKLSDHQVGQSVGLARSTVQDYVIRAKQAGLTWPLPPDLDDHQLEQQLFKQQDQAAQRAVHIPDWAALDRELRRKGVTRQLLWEEYRRQHPDGWQYATFNEHYRHWKAASGLTMRQTHRAGEKLFVDYAGLTVPITDPKTGKVSAGQVFVATLGASDYTYAEVTRTQSVPDWIASHVRALAFFGGVPDIIVPDNLKAGVHHASRYEPELNRTYQEFAQHYDVAIIPTRVRKPKDKALVEVHVQIVERRILAPLRDRVLFSVSEANALIWALVEALNQQPFQKRPGSRRSEFEALDRPLLRPLPIQPFEIAEWKQAVVGLDYHVVVLGHAYSVPHLHARTRVDVRLTPQLIEIYRAGQRIAVHHRVSEEHGRTIRHTTLAEHMPTHHRQLAALNADALIQQAQAIGEQTAALVCAIFDGEQHPEQQKRTVLGILRLHREYGARLEAACRHALFLQAHSLQSVRSILKHRLDEAELPAASEVLPVAVHSNLRGPQYFADLDEPDTDRVLN
ncbi:IS21 family transposase [Deinococcus soli (ex Cha et al. 2016)]|uniref:IS21 family transposase n=1 Tax=Deinococcus soli (ex Cha et al. 2016) TaxID=1309411 RepID=UPI0016664678|nr:IS21 family transposase [Deinococcus soli (ex Cha et al. 2016)]